MTLNRKYDLDFFCEGKRDNMLFGMAEKNLKIDRLKSQLNRCEKINMIGRLFIVLQLFC